jgi:hypothetical protein
LNWRCSNPDVNASLEDVFATAKARGLDHVIRAFKEVRQVQQKKHHDTCLRATIVCKLKNDNGDLSHISTEHKKRKL